MLQQQPPIGADVTSLMPQVGDDVSHLMNAAPAAPQKKSFWDHVSDAVSELHSLDPRTYADAASQTLGVVKDAAISPFSIDAQRRLVQDVVSLIPRNPEAAKRTEEAFKSGDYPRAVAHLLYTAIPYLGDRLSNAAAEGEKGNYGRMVGASVDTAGQFAVPELAVRSVAGVTGAVNRATQAARVAPKTQELTDAVKFAQANQIPLDAATATGSNFVQSVQKRVSDSAGGAGTAERVKSAQSQRLATVGEQLAEKANARPMQGPLAPGVTTRPTVPGPSVTPEGAGTLAQNSVRGVVKDQNAAATTQYDALRAIENQPANQRTVTMAGPDGDVNMPMALPVDLRATKSALSDMYTRLKQEGEVAPLMGQKAEAVRILNRIVTGPDYAPLSVVDAALSELKSFIRADNPDLRTPGQVSVVDAVKRLDADVRATAVSAGPNAVKALEAGRKATIAKYAAADVLKSLETGSGEAVGTFNRLTANRDASIGQLRDLARQSPEVLPDVGRAVIDGLMDTATADGGFQHAQAVRSKWNKMGPQTKLLLFKDPAYIKSVDDFFRLAEKIAENPNPSGTARINNLFNVVSAGVGYPLSKFLYSDAGVKLLTQGLTLPPSQAARALWVTRARKYAASQVPAIAQPAPASSGG